MNDSRISGLYKLGIAERIDELQRLGWLSSENARELHAGRQVISAAAADKMIENVVGVFGLPLAIAPNFIINGRDSIVPLVVEEPSIVAALSSAAALARSSGGFTSELSESLLAGQIHIVGITDSAKAVASINAGAADLMRTADAAIPRMSARGGGVRGIETFERRLPDGSPCLVVHVLVDTCDAMGANTVNTLCEHLAPEIAQLCGGEVALRILSNLADRSICTARVSYSPDVLATGTLGGETVRDRIVLANDIASVDPHRAATHNKGIMNGIDAVAIATGNDWRAIEAGAHAYAAAGDRYSVLTRWSAAADGKLVGEIALPLKVGTVGGTLASNPAAALGLAIAGVQSAVQLAEMMAAVGLAQNFAALRALATSGIQKGHMRLHARSVASAAGTPDDMLDEVVDKLVASGDIKPQRAKAILNESLIANELADASSASAAGKIILFGEHAAVYGRHALAIPIPDAVRATVSRTDEPTRLSVPEWGISTSVEAGNPDGAAGIVNCILDTLGVDDANFAIRVASDLPMGMGLGSSAAIAVAISRALAASLDLDIDDARINEIAFECEKLAHGTPSGIDNTLSCYGKAMLFKNSGRLEIETLELGEVPPLLVGFSRASGSTHEQVAGVRERYGRNESQYTAIFDQIDGISLKGKQALLAYEYDTLGELMNLCHGLLNAIGVSTPDLENMVSIARENGALGAKLTGAGGGGSVVALCPGKEDVVASALQRAGYISMRLQTTTGS